MGEKALWRNRESVFDVRAMMEHPPKGRGVVHGAFERAKRSGGGWNDTSTKEARQKLRLEVWKVVLTAVGSFVLISGLLLDRYKWQEDRRQKVEDELRLARQQLMTAIAEKYDGLFEGTSLVIEKANYRTLGLQTSFLMFELDIQSEEMLGNIDARRAERMLDISKEFREGLADRSFSLSEWADALEFLGKWKPELKGPTPDFAVFFSEELVYDWEETAEAARAALNIKFSPFAAFANIGEDAKRLERFRELGAKFQSRLHEELLEDLKSDELSPARSD